MIQSETKEIVVTIFLDVHCSVFQCSVKNMLPAANVQKTSLLHDYVISFEPEGGGGEIITC
jgi:hypothetical protein